MKNKFQIAWFYLIYSRVAPSYFMPSQLKNCPMRQLKHCPMWNCIFHFTSLDLHQAKYKYDCNIDNLVDNSRC